jgi:hypothetical protein
MLLDVAALARSREESRGVARESRGSREESGRSRGGVGQEATGATSTDESSTRRTNLIRTWRADESIGESFPVAQLIQVSHGQVERDSIGASYSSAPSPRSLTLSHLRAMTEQRGGGGAAAAPPLDKVDF